MSPAEIRTLLARAYRHDPLLEWIFPDAAHRSEAAAAWLGPSVERYVQFAQVDELVDARGSGAALWRAPGKVFPDDDLLPSPSGLLRALIGERRAAEVAAGFAAARASGPPVEQAVCYLHFLAVAPGSQGRGLGGQLLDGVLERSGLLGVPLRLDTTNPANLPFYETHGLRVCGAARLGDRGPVMWSLTTGSGITR